MKLPFSVLLATLLLPLGAFATEDFALGEPDYADQQPMPEQGPQYQDQNPGYQGPQDQGPQYQDPQDQGPLGPRYPERRRPGRDDGDKAPVKPGKPGKPGKPSRPAPGRPAPGPGHGGPGYPQNPGYPQQPGFPVSQMIPVRANFFGQARVNLAQWINLAQFQGMRLASVTLVASGQTGFERAFFCGTYACNNTAGMIPQVLAYRFPANGEWVDQAAYNWHFLFQGNIYVDHVIVEFFR